MKKTNLLMGAALAGLALAGGVGAKDTKDKAKEGECHGINGCKAQGDCGNKDHGCGGQNACKGQGLEKNDRSTVQGKERQVQTHVDGDVRRNRRLGWASEPGILIF
jgi:hypothetical protein